MDRPGFFHLDLNVMWQVDDDYVLTRKQRLEKKLSLGFPETPIKNLIAIYEYRLFGRRLRAVKMLEELLQEDPNNLNALANLSHMYKEMKREEDGIRCQETIDRLLKRIDDESRAQKGLFILEQAYAMTFEEHEKNNQTATNYLKKIIKMLQQRGGVHRGRKLVEEAYKLAASVQDKMMKNAEKKYKLAVEKFSKGITSMENIPGCTDLDVVFWKYFKAMALNRLDGILRESGMEAGASERRETLSQSAQLFCKIITMTATYDEYALICARSYAYLGSMLITRKEILDVGGNSPEYFENDCFKEVWDNPLLAFEKASHIKQEDETVLNRWGKALTSLDRYAESEEKLKLSIKIEPDLNWFAYASLRKTFIYWHRDEIRTAINKETSQKEFEEIQKLLIKARKYSLLCLDKSFNDAIDLLDLGRACLGLGKNPESRILTPGDYKDVCYIYEAIDFLHQALEYNDCSQRPKIYFFLAQGYFLIREYRQAIECLKKANEAVSSDFTSNFYFLCEYLFYFYQENREEKHLLGEAWCMLTEGERKFKNINRQLINICNKFPHDLLEMVDVCATKVYEQMAFNVCESLAKSRNKDIQVKVHDLKIKLNERFENEAAAEKDWCENRKFHTFPVSSRPQKLCQTYTFDFFVLHATVDGAWVDFLLRPALEERGEMSLRGCFPNIDFKIGTDLIDSSLWAIKNSFKTLLILSPDFISSHWHKFQLRQSFLEHLKRKKHCLIPIKLKDCDVPNELGELCILDFTTNNDWQKLHESLVLDDY